MKKALSLFLVLFGFILFNPFSESAFAASNVKKSGRKDYHNYIALNEWKFDSLKVGVDDTVVFLQDSGTTVSFTTASIGRIRNTLDGTYDRMPDSVQFIIAGFGEADSTIIEVLYQVSLLGNSGTYYNIGTRDTLTFTSASSQILLPKARKFYPNAHHKLQVKGTSASDTSRIQIIEFSPLFR